VITLRGLYCTYTNFLKSKDDAKFHVTKEWSYLQFIVGVMIFRECCSNLLFPLLLANILLKNHETAIVLICQKNCTVCEKMNKSINLLTN
jgi:hypothetical protein